jgi:hypothetical protein
VIEEAHLDNVVSKLWVQLVQFRHREMIQRLVLLLGDADCLSSDVVSLAEWHALAAVHALTHAYTRISNTFGQSAIE